MADDPRVDQLLEEIMESGLTPEVVCRDCPELLPAVLKEWERVRAVEAELAAAFPTHGPTPSDQDASRSSPSITLPDIPGYSDLSVLGRGGMGVVYKAQHLKLNRAVAIKMLLAGGYAAPSELARFMREAQAIASLRHPNIVQVFDVGEVDGRPYFTMEYIEGGSLAQRLAGMPQPARRAAEMVATLAAAMQVAHDGGIVHRDLKPANILLTEDGTPKITDFGLARHYEVGADLTLGGTRLGTPSYMSPEQAAGREGTVGPSSDIYSLGALLYEMLTGRPPFKAQTPAETERQVIHNEPPTPSRLNTRVPRDLETICLKCLRKESAQRYATAALLTEDLRRFLAGEPILARPVGVAERTGKWVRRHPSAAGMIGAVVLLVLLVAASVMWVGWQRAVTNRAVEEDLRQASEFERASDWNGARVAVERAKGRLGPDGSENLLRRIKAAEGELTLAARLEGVHFRFVRLSGAQGFLTNDQASEEYRAAFESVGLPANTGGPDDDAAVIGRSNISSTIIAALDDWALCAPERRPWIYSICLRLDPDPWRKHMRDPAVLENRAALEELAASAPVRTQPVRLLLLLAAALRKSGGDTMELLRAVQEQHPEDYWANFDLGQAFIETSPKDAVAYFRAATAIRPDAASAQYNLGMALVNAGKPAEAIRHFERVLEVIPDHTPSRNNMAVALIRLNRLDDAIDQLRQVLRIAPSEQMSHANLGSALAAKGELAAAAKEFQEAIRLGPDDARLHSNLASMLQHTGDEAGAIAEYDRALQLNASLLPVYLNYGEFLRDLGRLREAAEQLGHVVALDPRNAEYRNELRGVRMRLGEGEAVRAEWQNDLSSDPPEHSAWDGYAELCLFLGATNEYRRACRAMLVHFGDSTDVHIAERTARACLLMPMGEEELRSATALIDRALATDKSRYEDWMPPFLRFVKGLAEYRQNKFENAIALMQGRASNVMGPTPRLVIAMAQHRLGQVREARRTLAAAIGEFDWSPQHADIRDAWIFNILRREAEVMILPDLPAFLEGRYKPGDNDERMALRGVCQLQRRYAASAQLYADAFAADPALADDLGAELRYHAACAAALAGSRVGQDVPAPGPSEQGAWREQARRWLSADAATFRAMLKDEGARPGVLQRVTHWLADPELAGIRDAGELAKLPVEERERFYALWTEVRELQHAAEDAK